MRSVVFAYQEVGYVCLETLLDVGADVVAVFTHDDDPGEEIWFRSVRQLARSRGIPVFAPEKIDDEWIARLRALTPDFIFSFYYRRMLPVAALETAAHGAFNLHGSLLPKYRGRCPVNWVLVNGERETGVTLHYMVAKADSGDMVAQRALTITEEDSAPTLYAKLVEAAGALIRDVYPKLCDGSAPRIPQDHRAATYFGGRKPADGLIDWQWDARRIRNLVRAVTHPYPGAFTHWRGRPLFIWEAQVVDEGAVPPPPPGTVVAIDAGVVVQTSRGRLRLLRVQSEGSLETDAAAWARAASLVPGSAMFPDRIYHIVPRSELRAGIEGDAYTPRRFAEDGFVHCSATRASVLAVAADYFADVDEPLLVLEIDPSLSSARVLFEAPAPIGEAGRRHLNTADRFPHVYGPIDLRAIVGVGELQRRGSSFAWPRDFRDLSAET